MLTQLKTTSPAKCNLLFTVFFISCFALNSLTTFAATPPAKPTPKPQAAVPAQAASKPTTTVVSPTARNVQIYLKNGDDIKGQVVAYQPNKLFIKTPAGLKALNLNYYHGLILDTPEEQAFGNSITHKPETFEKAIEYTKLIRPILNKQLESKLAKLPNVCKPNLYPMVHMRFDKAGKVTHSELLTRSNCPHLNLAMAQAVKEANFPALPKDYPANIYVFNYFFPVEPTQAAPAKPTQAKPQPNTHVQEQPQAVPAKPVPVKPQPKVQTPAQSKPESGHPGIQRPFTTHDSKSIKK